MQPVTVNSKQGAYYILHKCTECGFERSNKTSKKDNTDKIIELSSHIHPIDK